MAVPSPSIKLQAFACPNCGAHAKQVWSQCYGDRLHGADPTPYRPDVSEIKEKIASLEHGTDREAFTIHLETARRLALGDPFIEGAHVTSDFTLHNVYATECFACHRVALWVAEGVIYPPVRLGPAANVDLTEDIVRDFEEARQIVNLSPRGAAALLRLCVQKLCLLLGQPGKNIDADIAALVANGLPPMVREALDAVRVIGNEAVHPGQMDLSDDRNTAGKLFGLVNFIAEQMISNPKQILEIYEELPESKRAAIALRDGKPKAPPGAPK